MNSVNVGGQRMLSSDWLLLTLIVLLPLMKPDVHYPIILADLIFVLLSLALAVEIATRGRKLSWHPAFAVLLLYVLGLAPSLIASHDLKQSGFKFLTEFYLVGLSIATVLVVGDRAMLRRATLAWLAATAAVAILAVVSLIAFAFNPASGLYQYAGSHFGSLPRGHYPRLSLSFFNANMACNYLTVSLGLLVLAWQQAWLSAKLSMSLLAGIVVAALSTISPGLGGIALALGMGAWIAWRAELVVAISVVIAIAFVIAQSVTPFLHPTAPFLIHVPGTGLILAPAGRFLTWSAATAEFLRHPILGHGIGIDAVNVYFLDPSGTLQQLTDAHNVFLSIAAQTGLAGLAGLVLLIGYAVGLTFSRKLDGPAAVRLVLGLTFLNAFAYQGLGGSFEDTRHLWVLFGLLAAAARFPLTHADGNSRRAGGRSPG
jgi:O-antigen ligase